jgi:hypothetical protein
MLVQPLLRRIARFHDRPRQLRSSGVMSVHHLHAPQIWVGVNVDVNSMIYDEAP